MKKVSRKNKKSPAAIAITALSAIAAAILICFCALYLFKGCQSENSSESAASENAYESQDPALSSLFVQSQENENLLEYTGDALYGMSYPEFILTDYGLLLYESDYSESETGTITFALLDLETGKLSATADLKGEFITDMRQTDGGIIFSDSSIGRVVLLDSFLKIVQEWSFYANYEYWYVSPDGKTLYMADEDSLIATDLESLSSEKVLESGVSLYGSCSLNGGALITYIDDEQMRVESWLDLESGSFEEMPFDEAANTAFCTDGIWLVSLEDETGGYIIGSEDSAVYVCAEDGNLSQIQNSDNILLVRDSRFLSLYDAQGNFISSCSFSEDDAWFDSESIIYSELYGGFFLLVYYDEGPALYFWKTNSDEDGEGLDCIPLSEYEEIPGGLSAEAYLYERAQAISQEYGIEVLIADQCETEYDDFTAEQISDADLIESGLDIIEDALSQYPEGFLNQLKYNGIKGIRISLMGALLPSNSNWGEEDYNGFSQEDGSLNIIIFDINQLSEDTVYHEISHIIDKKLEWDAYCREEALYSEEGWSLLNPDGFEYEYVYSGFLDLEFEGDEYLYFIDTYSMVSPTEDRARIMEYAMAGYKSSFSESEQIAAKLAYYSECIRDSFDTSGWPETTLWEEALN